MIETISLLVEKCPTGESIFVDLIVGAGHLGLRSNAADDTDPFVRTTQNVRVVVDHDQTVTTGNITYGICGAQDGLTELWVYGYLVSVNSPSLAP